MFTFEAFCERRLQITGEFDRNHISSPVVKVLYFVFNHYQTNLLSCSTFKAHRISQVEFLSESKWWKMQRDVDHNDSNGLIPIRIIAIACHYSPIRHQQKLCIQSLRCQRWWWLWWLWWCILWWHKWRWNWWQKSKHDGMWSNCVDGGLMMMMVMMMQKSYLY